MNKELELLFKVKKNLSKVEEGKGSRGKKGKNKKKGRGSIKSLPVKPTDVGGSVNKLGHVKDGHSRNQHVSDEQPGTKIGKSKTVEPGAGVDPKLEKLNHDAKTAYEKDPENAVRGTFEAENEIDNPVYDVLGLTSLANMQSMPGYNKAKGKKAVVNDKGKKVWMKVDDPKSKTTAKKHARKVASDLLVSHAYRKGKDGKKLTPKEKTELKGILGRKGEDNELMYGLHLEEGANSIQDSIMAQAEQNGWDGETPLVLAPIGGEASSNMIPDGFASVLRDSMEANGVPVTLNRTLQKNASSANRTGMPGHLRMLQQPEFSMGQLRKERGQHTVLIDDVFTSGGTMLNAGKAVEQSGGKIAGHFVLAKSTQGKGGHFVKPETKETKTKLARKRDIDLLDSVLQKKFGVSVGSMSHKELENVAGLISTAESSKTKGTSPFFGDGALISAVMLDRLDVNNMTVGNSAGQKMQINPADKKSTSNSLHHSIKAELSEEEKYGQYESYIRTVRGNMREKYGVDHLEPKR